MVNDAHPIGDIAWRTIAEALQRLQEDLDRPWSLEEMARVTGYELHHFAHVFRSVVGLPPARYVRRLRLERAAHELINEPERSLPEVAARAGYGAIEAFTRAFSRAFGVAPGSFRARAREQAGLPATQPRARPLEDPGDAPPGLALPPEILSIGPLRGWTVRAASFDDAAEVSAALGQLAAARPPDGPWRLGGIAQPWGWSSEGAARELRVLRVVSDAGSPPPPLLPWRMPRGWFARFDYAGPMDGIVRACAWIMNDWIPRSGLRAGFAPLFSLLDGVAADGGALRARLHAPIRPLRLTSSEDEGGG